MELVDLPFGASVIRNKWLYKKKTKPDKTFDRYKAQLGVQDFS